MTQSDITPSRDSHLRCGAAVWVPVLFGACTVQ